MKTGLIMEGGAMRGLFTCGVIDVFMENGIDFNGAAGISAGAVFGCNIKSKQIGRPLRYNTTYCNDPRYCSVRSLIKTGDMYGADFCYRQIMHLLDPFDTETFRDNPMEFYVGATDIESGKCVYHKCHDGLDEDTLWFRASASMPLVSRPVKIGGHLYLDGGMTDSIPYEIMLKNGYDRNVVILTQPEGFIKPKNKLIPLFKLRYRKYPKIAKVMSERHTRYNQQVQKVEHDVKKGKAFIIRPAESLNIGRVEKDPEELRRVYEIGRQTALKQLDAIREFLTEKE
ncbi:MAG: patatin family protein [Erysipelotrichaceae bacterium]|nr:patatin family protein [Erysipelotrichaceae bacterium]